MRRLNKQQDSFEKLLQFQMVVWSSLEKDLFTHHHHLQNHHCFLRHPCHLHLPHGHLFQLVDLRWLKVKTNSLLKNGQKVI